MSFFMIALEECPECGEYGYFSAHPMIKKNANRFHQVIGGNCYKCGFETIDEKETADLIKRFTELEEAYIALEKKKKERREPT